eukprot:g2661.t1
MKQAEAHREPSPGTEAGVGGASDERGQPAGKVLHQDRQATRRRRGSDVERAEAAEGFGHFAAREKRASMPQNRLRRTSSIFDTGDVELQYLEAAVLAVEAVHARAISKVTSSSRAAFNTYKRVHSGWYRTLYVVAVAVQMALAFWEPPSSFSDYNDPLETAADAHYDLLKVVECLCLGVVAYDVYLFDFHLGRKRFFKSHWLRFKLFFVVLASLLTIVSWIDPTVPLLHRSLRPLLLLAHLRNARSVANGILRSMPGILKVAMLLVFLISFFAIVGTVLFQGSTFGLDAMYDGSDARYGINDEYPAYGRQRTACNTKLRDAGVGHNMSWPLTYCSTWEQQNNQCTDYFSDVLASVMKLVIVITTANFPDVMLPAFNCSPWVTAVFFVIFIVFGFLFVANLVLAVAYQRFQARAVEHLDKSVRRRIELLDVSFDKLLEIERKLEAGSVWAERGNSWRGRRESGSNARAGMGASAHEKAAPALGSDAAGGGASDPDPGLDPPAAKEPVELRNQHVWLKFIEGVRHDLDAQRQRRLARLIWHALLKERADVHARLHKGPVPKMTGVRRHEFHLLPTYMEIKITGDHMLDDLDRPSSLTHVIFGTSVGDCVSSTRSRLRWFLGSRVLLRRGAGLLGQPTLELEGGCDDDVMPGGDARHGSMSLTLSARPSELQGRTQHPPRVLLSVEGFWDFCVWVNTALIIVSLYVEKTSLHAVEKALFAILCLFIFEVSSKIFGYGFRKYWRTSLMNKFDFVVALLAVTMEVYQLSTVGITTINEDGTTKASATGSASLGAFATLLRSVRLVRLLRSLAPFRIIIATFGQVVRGAGEYGVVTLVVYYVFAILGMDLFAGLIDYDAIAPTVGCFVSGIPGYPPPYGRADASVPDPQQCAAKTERALCAVVAGCKWVKPPAILCSLPAVVAQYDSLDGYYANATHVNPTFHRVVCSAYGKYHYWDLNFNSMGTTLVVLFYLMIVNNWVIIMEGYVAITSVGSRVYFVAWFFVIALVVLNVVTSFLLDFFTAQQVYNENVDRGWKPRWLDDVRKAAEVLAKATRASVGAESRGDRISLSAANLAAKPIDLAPPLSASKQASRSDIADAGLIDVSLESTHDDDWRLFGDWDKWDINKPSHSIDKAISVYGGELDLDTIVKTEDDSDHNLFVVHDLIEMDVANPLQTVGEAPPRTGAVSINADVPQASEKRGLLARESANSSAPS